MSVALRRIRRLLGTGSPRAVARATRRAAALRIAERELETALRSDRPLVVGPFLGEVGYELLYWRPYVLRLLRSREVDPARVTVVGRGGSGGWYAEYAAGARDAFELLPPDDVLRRSEARVRRTGQRKQLDVDELDFELARRARPGAALVHPLHMFWRWRFAWEGLRPVAEAVEAGDYEPLPPGDVPAEVAARLPERYVVVKAYFNECVPETAATRAGYAALVADLAAAGPVVLLQPGFAADDHEEWKDEQQVVHMDDLLRPETNLAVQAAVVAGADALVSTYGGFSYLGPFLGVATTAVGEPGEENRHHEAVLRAAFPDAEWTRIALPAVADSTR